MIKHLRFLIVLLLTLVWSTGWAAEAKTVVSTLAQKSSGCTSDVSGIVSWSYTDATSTDASKRGIQWSKPKDVKLTANFSSTVKIIKVVINANTNASTGSTIELKVGLTSYGKEKITKGAASATGNSDYTFTGTETNNAMTLILNSSKSLYVNTVTITYVEDTKTPTTLALGDYANKTFSFTNGKPDDTFTTPTATVTPEAATGAVQYTSSNKDIVTVATNGELSFTNTTFGSATISAQFIATGDYANSNTVTYTVVNKEPQKTATEVTFGDKSQQTITLTEGDVTGVAFPKASEKKNIAGTVSYESSNTDVAVVDADGNVSIKGAYGEATITATFTPTDAETYAVSTDWYKVVNKVNAAFYESFDKCAGKGGNDGTFNKTGNDKVLSDNTGWSFTNEYGANKCVKLGSDGKSGSAETPAINLSGKGLLTFKVASWVGDNSEVNVSVDNGTLIYNGKEGKSFVLSPTDTEWNDINMIISMTGSVKVKFYSTNP